MDRAMTTEPRAIRVALPNKGRLSEQSLALFEQAGLKAAFRADRALVASLGGEFEAIFVRAGDVPEYIADGAAEIGVTGADLVAESGRDIEEVLDLGFGRCRLAIAVKDEARVERASDLPAGTRVATSFPAIARRYFERIGTEIQSRPGWWRGGDRSSPGRRGRHRRSRLHRLYPARQRPPRGRNDHVVYRPTRCLTGCACRHAHAYRDR